MHRLSINPAVRVMFRLKAVRLSSLLRNSLLLRWKFSINFVGRICNWRLRPCIGCCVVLSCGSHLFYLCRFTALALPIDPLLLPREKWKTVLMLCGSQTRQQEEGLWSKQRERERQRKKHKERLTELPRNDRQTDSAKWLYPQNQLSTDQRDWLK